MCLFKIWETFNVNNRIIKIFTVRALMIPFNLLKVLTPYQDQDSRKSYGLHRRYYWRTIYSYSTEFFFINGRIAEKSDHFHNGLNGASKCA